MTPENNYNITPHQVNTTFKSVDKFAYFLTLTYETIIPFQRNQETSLDEKALNTTTNFELIRYHNITSSSVIEVPLSTIRKYENAEMYGKVSGVEK